MLILGDKSHAHDQGEHAHAVHEHADHQHVNHDHDHSALAVDHNLKAAYTHVLTDALTSVLAIFALFTAKYLHLVWMDPLMGIVGAILVIRWSIGLLQGTTTVLLDHQIPVAVRDNIVRILENYKDTRVSDLHIWSIGPGIYSSEVSVVTSYPSSPDYYKDLIPPETGVVHTTVEVHLCPD